MQYLIPLLVVIEGLGFVVWEMQCCYRYQLSFVGNFEVQEDFLSGF